MLYTNDRIYNERWNRRGCIMNSVLCIAQNIQYVICVFDLLPMCMHYALCVMHYALCIMHYLLHIIYNMYCVMHK